MPQFEVANFAPQFAWLVLVFAILYFGIVGTTLPKLARTVTAREDKVSGDIGAAEQAKAESDRVRDAYATEMKQAHVRAQAAVADGKARAIAETEAKLAAANAELDTRQDKAFAALQVAQARAMADIQTVAAEAAADIVARLGWARPDDATALDAVRTALAA